ncbi:PIN domain-containing protein [soil metagenome]
MTDVLIDAGPLIAIFNRSDQHHRVCVDIVQSLDSTFYTTLPVVTEAMHVAGARLGWVAQNALWKLVLRGDLLLEHPTLQDLERMHALMVQYRDRPIDFADASLVALAERLSLVKLFTVNRRDFSVYRLEGKKAFTVIGP